MDRLTTRSTVLTLFTFAILFALGLFWLLAAIPDPDRAPIRSHSSSSGAGIAETRYAPPQAELPWNRDLDNPASTTVPIAFSPWLRPAGSPVATIPTASLPWVRDVDSPVAVRIPRADSLFLRNFDPADRGVTVVTADVPWKRDDSGHTRAVVASAKVPWSRFVSHTAPISLKKPLPKNP